MDNIKEILLPLVEEAIKNLKGIQIRSHLDYTTLLLAKLPEDVMYSGSFKFTLKDSIITMIYHYADAAKIEKISLGDPNLIKKLRAHIVKWRRMAKSKYIRNLKKQISQIKINIKRKEKDVFSLVGKIDKYKNLFR